MRVTLLIALTLLAGCERRAHPVRPGEPVVRLVEGRPEVVIGPRTTNVLGAPTNVRAYRVLSPFAKNFEALRGTKPSMHEYPILAQSPVPATTARQIAGILLDATSYDPEFATDCRFDPEHALRFERGSDIVDVILCFKCSDLMIIPADPLGEKSTTRPFGRVAKSLYREMQTVFPEPR